MKNNTSNEVVIKNSLRGGFLNILWRIFIILALAVFVVASVWLFFNFNSISDIFWGAAVAIGGSFGIYFMVESMIKETVIATISDKGIDVADKAFVPWEHVKSFKNEVDGIISQSISGPGSDINIVYYEDGNVEKPKSVRFDSEYSSYTNEGIIKILEEFYERYKSEPDWALPEEIE